MAREVIGGDSRIMTWIFLERPSYCVSYIGINVSVRGKSIYRHPYPWEPFRLWKVK